MEIKVAPSILSADFGNLAADIGKVAAAGADWIHVDVMDGHFVPNITIGPGVVKDIRKATRLPLDVHLMIENAQNFSDAFLAAGADMLTYHIEAMSHDVLAAESRKLRQAKRGMGISLNPATPASAIVPVLGLVDFILVMSVNPGFGGQAFMPEAVPKIGELRKVFKGDISVDGGISDVTAKAVVSAGASVLAAGSYIFKSADYAQAIRSLKCAK